MNADQAIIYNAAIEAAMREHHKGIDAIAALKKKVVCSVKHTGYSTRQECEVQQ